MLVIILDLMVFLGALWKGIVDLKIEISGFEKIPSLSDYQDIQAALQIYNFQKVQDIFDYTDEACVCFFEDIAYFILIIKRLLCYKRHPT